MPVWEGPCARYTAPRTHIGEQAPMEHFASRHDEPVLVARSLSEVMTATRARNAGHGWPWRSALEDQVSVSAGQAMDRSTAR